MERQRNLQNSDDSNDDHNSSFINNTLIGGSNRHQRALRTEFPSRWNLPPPHLVNGHSQFPSTSTLSSSSTTNSFDNGNGVSSDYLTNLRYVEEQGLPSLRIESPTLGQRQITHDQVQLNPNTARNRVIAQRLLPIASTVNNFSYDYASEYVQEQRRVRVPIDNLPILRTRQSEWKFAELQFELMDVQQMDIVLQSMVLRDQTSFIRSCNHYIRKERVKALITNLKTRDQNFLVAWVIGRHINSLANNTYGQGVVLFLLFYIVDDVILKFLFGEMAKHCKEIASDPIGCRLFQRCIRPFIRIRNIVNQLLDSIISNSLYLSENPYGNYVVQHVISFGIDGIRRDIVRELEGKFVDLSMNKYGSNVVESCLTVCTKDEVYSIISELSNPNYFLRLLQHPFGNFVIQSALQASKNWDEELYRQLVRLIRVHSSSLRSHIFGERVWNKICEQ